MPEKAAAGLPLILTKFPLITVVVVDADHIQKVRRTTQFRFPGSTQHVPGFELGLPVHQCVIPKIRLIMRSNDVYEGIAVQNASGGIDLPDNLATFQRGAHQPPF